MTGLGANASGAPCWCGGTGLFDTFDNGDACAEYDKLADLIEIMEQRRGVLARKLGRS